MNKKILFVTLLVSTAVILAIPLLLNNSWISENVSWYFAGLRTPDYKMTYISFIGGIIGVWLTVGTTLLIQMIFDSNDEKEKKIIVDQMVLNFLVDEIRKNHDALTTCNSQRHKFEGTNKSVLQLIKDGHYGNIGNFKSDFSITNWLSNMNVIYKADLESYIVLLRLYSCYKSIVEFKVNSINKRAYFEKSGIFNYEKHYEKFERKFGFLMEETVKVRNIRESSDSLFQCKERRTYARRL